MLSGREVGQCQKKYRSVFIPAQQGYELLSTCETDEGKLELERAPIIAFQLIHSVGVDVDVDIEVLVMPISVDESHMSEDAAILYPDGRCYVYRFGPWFKTKEEYFNFRLENKAKLKVKLTSKEEGK